MKTIVLSGKITSLLFSKSNGTWPISVNSFCVSKKSEADNPGAIIENYRKQLDNNAIVEANNYLLEKMPIIKDFINKCHNPVKEKPDYIQVFRTEDKLRNEIIDLFNVKMIEGLLFNDFNPDYSEDFTKKNKNLSIKAVVGTIEEKAQNYEYKKPDGVSSIKTLWIIDDTIDKGETIEIFLNYILNNGLLNNETKIFAFILYNNQKKEFKMTYEEIKSKWQELND